MPIYVLGKKESEVIDTIVFHAGDSGEQEAIAAFTNKERAQEYLTAAQWNEPHEVVAMEPVALLQWIVQAYGQRIGLLTIDPQRHPQIAGHPQAVLSIEEELKNCSETLVQRIGQTK